LSSGFRFRVWGLGFRVQGSGSRFSISWRRALKDRGDTRVFFVRLRVQGLGFRVYELGFGILRIHGDMPSMDGQGIDRVKGLGFRVKGLGFRV
jgi:hypothetical protein